MNPVTPDGRYFVVNGRLWRCSNPAIEGPLRQRLVNELMNARRAVKAAKASGGSREMKTAHAAVQTAKSALGERGPVWWDDGAPELNRHTVESTPYADWYQQVSPAATG